MDTPDQKPSGASRSKQQIDFGAKKSPNRSQPSASYNHASVSNSSTSPGQSLAPTPVISAKAKINALYAERNRQAPPQVVTSAREAVNAAAHQAGVQHTKAAANLHHGSIQRSMESTRTSASALLRRADDEPKVATRIGSLDPLAKVQPTPVQKRPEREVPIVRTSLKLGAAARPKPAPVVFPPHARMAQVAHPVQPANQAQQSIHQVNQPTPAPSGKLTNLLHHSAVDAQIIPPQIANASPALPQAIEPSTPAKALVSGQPNASPQSPVNNQSSTINQPDHSLAVKIIPSNPTPTPASPTSQIPRPKPQSNVARDSQMLAGARRGLKARVQSLSQKAQTAEALGMATAHSPRFRAKPKGFSAQKPATMAANNAYIMTEPPKIKPQRHATASELGVVESYHPEKVPQTLGDKAPIGSLQAQKVASGHVDAAPELPTIKADNTSNYSFSKPKSGPDNNRYTLGGESPFLKSVNVEKRPLSASPKKLNPKIERQTVAQVTTSDGKTSAKSGRKNHYTKKAAPTSHSEPPVRPTVIVPSNRRSKAPLVFLIIATVVLGAAVGAAVYLCFFQ